MSYKFNSLSSICLVLLLISPSFSFASPGKDVRACINEMNEERQACIAGCRADHHRKFCRVPSNLCGDDCLAAFDEAVAPLDEAKDKLIEASIDQFIAERDACNANLENDARESCVRNAAKARSLRNVDIRRDNIAAKKPHFQDLLKCGRRARTCDQ